MIKTFTKQFELTISNLAYQDKNKIQWSKVNYHTITATIGKVMDYLKQGYCINSVYNKKAITQSEKTQANFRQTNIVFFDIDNSVIPMKEYVSNLTNKPTIYYTTRNNNVEGKGYRFRLLYFVEQAIETIDQYRQIYDNIALQLEKDTKEQIQDRTSRSGVLNISGNAQRNIEYNVSYNVYSLGDFSQCTSHNLEPRNSKKINYDSKSIKTQFSDKEFAKDYQTLSIEEILNKYKRKYQIITNTAIKYNCDGYALLDTNYIELKHLFNADGTIRKRVDGELRRNHLYCEGVIIKKIKNNVSFEELLYNIIYNSIRYYNNADGQLNKRTLLLISQYAYNADIQINTKDTRKFKVDKNYCLKHGITPNQHKQVIKKKLNDDSISKWYDNSKSVKENLKYAKEHNIKVSERKLYQYKKEYITNNEKGKRTQETKYNTIIITMKPYIKPKNTIITINDYTPFFNIKNKHEKNNKNKEYSISA